MPRGAFVRAERRKCRRRAAMQGEYTRVGVVISGIM
jgi:hypothetical protein